MADDLSEDGGPNSPASPPPTPPCVTFFPPMHLQRRAKVHSLLQEISTKVCTIKSLLDVGCGTDALLLGTLNVCEEDLPLEVLTGIDIDDRIWTEGVKNAFGAAQGEPDEDRWRDLTVNLLNGSFVNLATSFIGNYDAITSCEVIEHLDSDILNQFAPVLLGRLRPKVFIVTTPNREFNRLFEMPFSSLEPDPESQQPFVYDPFLDPQQAGRRYYRSSQTYAMRHHDHRFEWTRDEFQAWAKDAAERFGYNVLPYTGCGRLGDGMQIAGRGWDVAEALSREMENMGEQEVLDMQSLSFGDTMRRVFGYCTQIAVFVRLDVIDDDSSSQENEEDEEEDDTDESDSIGHELPYCLVDTLARPVNGIRLVESRIYKAAQTGAYPPTLPDLLNVMEAVSISFLPTEILSYWTRDPYDILENVVGKDVQYEVVVVETDADLLWKRSSRIQRLCRNKFSVFLNVMMQKWSDRDNSDGGTRSSSYEISDSTMVVEGKSIELRRIHYHPTGISSRHLTPPSERQQTKDDNSDSKDEDESDRYTNPGSYSIPPNESIKIETKIIYPLTYNPEDHPNPLFVDDPIQFITTNELKDDDNSIRIKHIQLHSQAIEPEEDASSSCSFLFVFYKPEMDCDAMYNDSMDMSRFAAAVVDGQGHSGAVQGSNEVLEWDTTAGNVTDGGMGGWDVDGWA